MAIFQIVGRNVQQGVENQSDSDCPHTYFGIMSQ